VQANISAVSFSLACISSWSNFVILFQCPYVSIPQTEKWKYTQHMPEKHNE